MTADSGKKSDTPRQRVTKAANCPGVFMFFCNECVQAPDAFQIGCGPASLAIEKIAVIDDADFQFFLIEPCLYEFILQLLKKILA